MSEEKMSVAEIAKRASGAIARVVVYIILYVVVSAVVHFLMSDLVPRYGFDVAAYESYV